MLLRASFKLIYFYISMQELYCLILVVLLYSAVWEEIIFIREAK